MCAIYKITKNSARLKPRWFVTILLVAAAGMVYRNLEGVVTHYAKANISLPVPLKFFPEHLENWTGVDVPVPEAVQRVSANDDFLSRVYIDKDRNIWANVYVGYSSRPRTMLGHRPDVCYVGNGWIHDGTENIEITSSGGRRIPCLIHYFHKPAPSTESTIVLNFYVLNSEVVSSEKSFSGLGWRTPNIDGDPARYVAQVQISSTLENSVRQAAADMADIILDFLPK